ncbi:MAG TPA: LLM class flavin-dependent oxidoreductase [Acidimicrobiia bacterium]|nr:LLM class flavin-dependent oxidoreductase [Acidimicrobiia bacterium]
MQFSMIFEAQMAHPTAEHEREVLQNCVEQAVSAEEMGFDRIWAVEHHALRWYAHMSAPEIFLTWVAARTSRIRIGHGVVCMPFNYNHPVRVGERAAMLDNLSGGRLDLGAGRGATLQEMSLCGVDPERTYQEVEEALRMIGRMWQQDTFEWRGNLLTVEPIANRGPHYVLPRPVQRPHPPLFLACTKRDTVALAAEYGIGALVLGFAGVEEVAGLRKIYDDAIATRTGERFVSTVVNDHFSALCPTIVLDDGDEALRIGARGQRFFAEAIAHWYGGGPPPAQDTEAEDNVAAITREREEIVAKLHEANIPVNPNTTATFNIDHAYGTAERAIAYVEQLEDAGANEIMCLMQMGTVPHDACMETIRQWGETVIPHFRAKQP